MSKRQCHLTVGSAYTQFLKIFRMVIRFLLTSLFTFYFIRIERFSSECRKTKTKVITPANHNKHKLPNEPITTRRKYM